MPKERRKALLEDPRAVPNIGIPVTSETVDVRIINTTCYQKTNTNEIFDLPIAGHNTISFPSYAFLITNCRTKSNVLFDLGMRKDWRKACPEALAPYISDDGGEALLQVTVEKDIFDILDAEQHDISIKSRNIDAVIWSHHHFDHRGDMSKFPPHTKLIVGPGLLQAYLHTEIHESEIQGRPIIELSETELDLEIGGYAAHDAFGDGSFYIMSCPGHTVGHLCALARVTTSPNSTYVLLGGDCSYHCGEFRPSPYLPLPKQIAFKASSWHFQKSPMALPPVLKTRKILLCAGEFIKDMLHPCKSANEPFYNTPIEPVVNNRKEACDSLVKLELFDAHDDVLTCVSHDASLMTVLPFFPYTMNDWFRKGYKQKLLWEFLNDFDLDQNPISPPIFQRRRF